MAKHVKGCPTPPTIRELHPKPLGSSHAGQSGCCPKSKVIGVGRDVAKTEPWALLLPEAKVVPPLWGHGGPSSSSTESHVTQPPRFRYVPQSGESRASRSHLHPTFTPAFLAAGPWKQPGCPRTEDSGNMVPPHSGMSLGLKTERHLTPAATWMDPRTLC